MDTEQPQNIDMITVSDCSWYSSNGKTSAASEARGTIVVMYQPNQSPDRAQHPVLISPTTKDNHYCLESHHRRRRLVTESSTINIKINVTQ